MTTALYNAVTTADSLTENGAVTHSTTGSELLNMFFGIGASRHKSENEIVEIFIKSYSENKDYAIRCLLWSRDILKGAGERRAFRTILKYLIDKDLDVARAVMARITEDGIGRWDDLFVAFGTPAEDFAVGLYMLALSKQDRLAAKWAPRKGPIANILRTNMNLTPKQYRKLIVSLSDTVEQKMCAKLWDEIEYSHVPSVAHAKYRKAFGRHSPERYSAYINRVREGTEKINAKAIFPHDIITPTHVYYNKYSADEIKALEAQWYALPNYVFGNEKVIPMIDVSGSMTGVILPNSSKSIFDVAVTLGIYVSERLEGVFKDHVITFSTKPRLKVIKGSIADRLKTLGYEDVGYSTDFQAAFDMILNAAVSKNLKQEDLPSKILILSDMEFNSCGPSPNFNEVDRKFKAAGYTRPQLVFWNMSSRSSNNFPVKLGEAGTALISGYSPAILSSVMTGDLDPFNIVLKTIMDERYNY